MCDLRGALSDHFAQDPAGSELARQWEDVVGSVLPSASALGQHDEQVSAGPESSPWCWDAAGWSVGSLCEAGGTGELWSIAHPLPGHEKR